MSKMEELADELAVSALDLEEETDDETVIKKIAEALGSLSPTFEEVFNTAIRMRRAERRAKRLIASLKRDAAPAALPPVSDPD